MVKKSEINLKKGLVLALFSLVLWPNLSLSQTSSIRILASREISLENRHQNSFVNSVFKDNILLTLFYLKNGQAKKAPVDWPAVRQPFHYEFSLPVGKTFAFHEDVLALYRDVLVKTTNAHFGFGEGFKSDGYLIGDGVCHLASLFNWVSQEAGLKVESPNNHNFAAIPEVPKEFGTSVYYLPGAPSLGAQQNLYVTNNQDRPIFFKIDYFSSGQLKMTVATNVKI